MLVSAEALQLWGPRDYINKRILHPGSEAKERGIEPYVFAKAVQKEFIM